MSSLDDFVVCFLWTIGSVMDAGSISGDMAGWKSEW
jgi:hypothetical protein